MFEGRKGWCVFAACLLFLTGIRNPAGCGRHASCSLYRLCGSVHSRSIRGAVFCCFAKLEACSRLVSASGLVRRSMSALPWLCEAMRAPWDGGRLSWRRSPSSA